MSERGGRVAEMDACLFLIDGRRACQTPAAFGFYRRGEDPRTPTPACPDHLGHMLVGEEWTVVTLAYHREVMRNVGKRPARAAATPEPTR